MNRGNGIVEDGEITEDGWHSVWYIKTHTSRHMKNICAVLNILLIVTDEACTFVYPLLAWSSSCDGLTNKTGVLLVSYFETA